MPNWPLWLEKSTPYPGGLIYAPCLFNHSYWIIFSINRSNLPIFHRIWNVSLFLIFTFFTDKKNWYKSVRDTFFPPLAILAFLFSVLITISYHNCCIENRIYDQLNEIYHKENPTLYEQFYFETELNALKTLEEHNELSLCANYDFHYSSDPLDKIFPYYELKEAE